MDPLVINFGGTAAEVSTTRFRFDLDANGDGKINSGAELFGPQSGDGFAELARYDADGNGWIDAADPEFSRLRIWTKDEQGRDRLFALAELGVGAPYTGSVAAGFTVKDADNRSLALNQKAGLFVRENGTAGTIQQLDLMV